LPICLQVQATNQSFEDDLSGHNTESIADNANKKSIVKINPIHLLYNL